MKITKFLQKLKQLDSQQLAQKNGIGQIIIDSLEAFVQSHRYNELLNGFQKLEELGISPSLIEKKIIDGNKNLNGKIAVITGTMEIPRTELKDKLEILGIKVMGAVTKKTDFLLSGQNSGSKTNIARELGIRIIEGDSWLDFEKYLLGDFEINPR